MGRNFSAQWKTCSCKSTQTSLTKSIKKSEKVEATSCVKSPQIFKKIVVILFKFSMSFLLSKTFSYPHSQLILLFSIYSVPKCQIHYKWFLRYNIFHCFVILFVRLAIHSMAQNIFGFCFSTVLFSYGILFLIRVNF